MDTANLLKFNMNSYVYFKPKALGFKLYEDYYNSLMWKKTLRVNTDGFAELQFHNFIAIYGQAICSVYNEDAKPFESYDVFFAKKDLKSMAKYYWTNAPKDVEYIATDSNGTVKGFTGNPMKCIAGKSGEWTSNYEYYLLKNIEPYTEGWEDSLEQRPTGDI